MCCPTASAADQPNSRSAAGFQEVITPSSVLPTIAAFDDSTIAGSRAAAAASAYWPVTSRVKQRVCTNRPSSQKTLEVTRTSRTLPSLHRSRAG